MQDVTIAQNLDTEAYSPNEVFFCPEESRFYSQCLEKMIFNRCTPFDTIVEFGSGDGSPVIDGLLKSNFLGTVHGYELNPAAARVARSRVERYGLKNKYIIHDRCFFQHFSDRTRYLIANPPYLPAPDNDLYMPQLHGGTDGATITKQLLSMDSENVMLMLSAYSNPIETVQHAVARGYRVIDFLISPLPFGYYSREPKVKRTIARLRRERKAFYSGNIYFLAGALFSKKVSTETPDISEEFLKVMTVL
jgi:hypothetical protein